MRLTNMITARFGTVILSVFTLLSPAVRPVVAGSVSLDVSSFGAVADGTTLNTAAIQKAIDTCSGKGGGTVRFAAGKYVSGTILLKDNVTLHLDEGAVLLGSLDIGDYQMIDGFRDGRGSPMGYCFVGALGATNIGIEGQGTIDGRGKALLDGRAPGDRGKRPFLVRLVRCSNVAAKNFHLHGSAAWTMHLSQCQNVKVEHIQIDCHEVGNNDGIDVDSSENVSIRNCDIYSGDDSICLKTTSPSPCRNIEVTGCKLRTHWGGVKLGTESVGDFENLKMTDCRFTDCHGGIKLLSVDGAHLRNVLIANITMDNVTVPIFIRLGARLKTFRAGDAPKPVGAIENVAIENIRADCVSPIGILISGIPDHAITGVRMEKLELHLPGGGTRDEARAVLEEKESAYPEITMFGKQIPAYGIFARHVKGLKLHDAVFTVKAPDARPAVVCQMAGNVEFSGVKAPIQEGAEAAVRFESVQSAAIEDFQTSGTPAAFLRVEGASSSGIVLHSGAHFELAPGVNAAAVTVH